MQTVRAYHPLKLCHLVSNSTHRIEEHPHRYRVCIFYVLWQIERDLREGFKQDLATLVAEVRWSGHHIAYPTIRMDSNVGLFTFRRSQQPITLSEWIQIDLDSC